MRKFLLINKLLQDIAIFLFGSLIAIWIVIQINGQGGWMRLTLGSLVIFIIFSCLISFIATKIQRRKLKK